MKVLKNLKKLLNVSALLFLIIILGTSCTSSIANTDQLTGGFPYKIDFENYNIQINYGKMYESYILFDYFITKKDGSEIKESDIHITGGGEFIGKTVADSPTHILTEIKDNKLHIITTCDIQARENKTDPIKYQFMITGNDSEKTGITTKEKFNLSTEGYKSVDKKIKLDEIDFNVISLGNFEFGSLINFYVENMDQKRCEEISKEYSIYLKSENFENSYSLDRTTGFLSFSDTGNPIKRLSDIDKKYNPNSQCDQFYISKILYDQKKIDTDKMELYLVNNLTSLI